MGMRIRTNVPALKALGSMRGNSYRVSQSLEKLSSGYRINKASDDAAGLAISENLRGQVRGLNQAKRNANDAISMVQVTEGAMNEMTNIILRMRELTVSAATDILGPRERSYLQKEYAQLTQEVDRIALSTEFNGIKVFDPDDVKTEYVFQIGPNDSSEQEVGIDAIKLDIEGLKFTTESLELAKSLVGPTQTDPEGPGWSGIVDNLNVIDNSLDRISTERATLGAVQNRLTSAIKNLDEATDAQAATKSRITDVDFAQESSQLASAQLMLNANVAVLSQANANGETALRLIT